jgi:glycosyltransferase involved in cell wall biosynthesis
LKIKVTYIISNINKAVSFEWVSELIDKNKIELSFILLNADNSDLEKYLISNGFYVKRIKYKNKFSIPKALFCTIIFLIKQKPQAVHTHLFDANIVGLLAAWLCRVKKRIYTRHHSSYHHDFFPKAVKYDELCNYLATDIIAITVVVKEILEKKENVPGNKIQLIHHGFKLNYFHVVPEKEIQIIKQKYSTSGFYPVIGVISRYTEWKGVQFIIPAFEKLLLTYPDALLILANASGDYKKEIQGLLQKIPKKNYIEIPFEPNVPPLYKLFDIFVHVPISPEVEAFGQTYVECLAAGIPLVATKSGIANEVLIDKYNSLIVPYKNSEAIYNSMIALLTDENLRKHIISNSYLSVSEKFNVELMIQKLEALYLN